MLSARSVRFEKGKAMQRVLLLEGNLKRGIRLKAAVFAAARMLGRDVELYLTSSEEEARQEAWRHVIDLFIVAICIDHKFTNRMGGLTFAQDIRATERYECTPLVFIGSECVDPLKGVAKFHYYDFLELPFDTKRCIECFRGALKLASLTKVPRSFYIRYENKSQRIVSDEVVYGFSRDRKLNLRTVDASYDFYYVTLNKVLSDLPEEQFIRCSRNAFFNLTFFEWMDMHTGEIHLKGEYPALKVGEQYKHNLRLLFR